MKQAFADFSNFFNVIVPKNVTGTGTSYRVVKVACSVYRDRCSKIPVSGQEKSAVLDTKSSLFLRNDTS